LHGAIHDQPQFAEADQARETEFRSLGGKPLVIRHDNVVEGVAALTERLT
jgi:hypothetical protein